MNAISRSPVVPAYSAVNEALNRIVFDGRYRLSPVYLDIESDIARELAAALSLPEEEVLDAVARAVASTLTWRSSNPLRWHLDELDAWNLLERFGAPPFTALLAVLSLAAERMRADGEFSAQNYYERLFELLGVTDETRKNSLKFNARWKKGLWESLNQWLAENDFDFGRPTAKPVNGWAYVSYALSQALVRDVDRRRLHSLFVEYGLAPHEQLTDAEMTLYLHEWMRGPAPSSWLRRVWASADLRPRVASAACAELVAWQGAEDTSEGSVQRRRLSWAVSFHRFPSRKLAMFMSAAGAEDGGQLTLKLSEGASPAAQAAFEGCSSGLWMTPHGEVSVIEPTREIALSPLMLASFELQTDDGSLSFQRAARAIVPLVKLDTGPFYREVSRVSFLRPHLVLCHEKWRSKVVGLLTQCARQGFSEWTVETLPGLPPDWVLFDSVEMLRLSSTSDVGLQALVPLSEGMSVEMAGGLRLSPNLWHAAAPPEITAAAPGLSPLGLSLKNGAGEVLASSTSKNSTCRLTLSAETSWEALDLTLAASVGDKVRSESSVSFRSANQPRRLAEDADHRAYNVAPEDGAGFMSAAVGHHTRSVRGGTLQGEWKAAAGAETEPLCTLDGEFAPGEEAPFEMSAEYQLQIVEGLQETCVLRGYHTWLVDEFKAGDVARDDWWMSCTACKNRVLTRNRGVPGKTASRRPGSPTRGAVAPAQPSMRPRDGGKLDPDLILDALSYLGSGTWRKLQDLATGEAQPPLATTKITWALNALGHLDATYDERLRSPISWEIAPPALVFTALGTAFLTGFRSADLVSVVSVALDKAGAVLEIKPQEFAPSAYIWSRITAPIAEACLAGVRDVHGRQITVTTDFTRHIAANAPAVSRLALGMPAVRLDKPKGLQRFDPQTAAWRTVGEVDQTGAYRGDYGGRRYIFRDAAGEQREGNFSLVKLLAAKSAGVKLHGFDASRGVFQSVIGCEPPGLFARALVAGSGLLPRTSGAQQHYSGISRDAASAILSKLYS